MKILILEDSKERIKTFKQKLIGNDVYFFDRVDDAKEALNLLGPFDVIFLDHDLDDRIFVNSNEENTGYQLAKYISENNIKADQIILHSLNPAGVARMKAILPEAVCVPFPMLF